MSLVGCFVMPHPPIVVPEVGAERVAEAQATFDAMSAAGQMALALRPDVMVLLSPHAPLDPERVTVCTASHYIGSLSMFGAPEVRLDLEGDHALANAIVAETRKREVPVMVYRDGEGRALLDHGALVPLVFLLKQFAQRPAFVELNFSFREPEVHLAFGQAVGAAIEADQKRIVYVASGDLSHRLTRSAPAGYNPKGAEFDSKVAEIVASGDLESLTSISPGLVDAAGECGYRSLLVLAGLLRGRPHAARLLSYEGPFGVGYLVAAIDMLNQEGES